MSFSCENIAVNGAEEKIKNSIAAEHPHHFLFMVSLFLKQSQQIGEIGGKSERCDQRVEDSFKDPPVPDH